MRGEDVVMVSGSDEHGTPTEVEAIKLGISPKELADKNHGKIVELCKKWAISFTNYTRTENPVHREYVQGLMMKIYDNGYIFTKETEMLYCPRDARFLPDRFVEGKCPYCGYERARGDQCESCGRLLEPTTLIEPHCAICGTRPIKKTTKHWYFDLTRFESSLKGFINDNKRLPANARNFSLNWLKEGLTPRAVTRDVAWGIPAPFPGAEGKTIYVWFDAVLGYVSATIEYFRKQGEPEKWREYWFDKHVKTIYFIGKDNIPFHTIILPSLLLASGEDYNLPWNVPTTEFLQIKGVSFSKSRRIGIWIDEAMELFPPDYWRFFLIANRPETKDANFTWELFASRINADLNDTLGNFIHRTLTFVTNQFSGRVPEPAKLDAKSQQTLNSIKAKVEIMAAEIEDSKLQSAANTLISLARLGNQYLNENEPWNLVKEDKEKAGTVMYVAMQIVKALVVVSAPIVPFAAEETWKTLNLAGQVDRQKWKEALTPIPPGHLILKAIPLFRKIEEDENELNERLEKIRQQLSSKPEER
jgi:methionyl-tRNA synthetase